MSTATLPLGPRGLSPSLPPGAFLETGGGRDQGCCLVFVFVWALTLFSAMGTVGTRPNPGTVLCCVYVSPMLQESGQEGLPRSWIARLHFCLDVGHLAFMASLSDSFFTLSLGLMTGESPLPSSCRVHLPTGLLGPHARVLFVATEG